MKKLALLFLLASGALRAASVPLGMAQVLIDPTTGLLQSIPTTGGGGAASAVTVLSSALPTGAATQATSASILSAFSGVTVNAHGVTSIISGLNAGGVTTLAQVNGSGTTFDVTTTGLHVRGASYGWDGGVWQAQKVDTNGTQFFAGSITNTVNVSNQGGNLSITAGTATIGAVGITNSATSAVQVAGSITNTVVTQNTGGITVTNTAASAVQVAGSVTNTVSVAGNVSATVTDSGNPIKTGGKASTALPTAVAAGARVDGWYDKNGRVIVSLGGPRERKVMATLTLSTTTETTLIAATASTFHDIETLMASNGSTQTVRVDLRTTTGGAVVQSVWLAPGGGYCLPIHTILPQAAVNTNWTAQLSTGIATNDVRIFATSNDNN